MPSLARNTSYFTLALIVQKIISLTYFTLYARSLGAADLGQYYFAISITSIFGIFIDFGVGNVVTREVSKHQEKAKSILASVIALKLPLTILTVSALIAWAKLWDYDPLIQELIFISAIAMVFDNFTSSFYAVARGFHNLKFESFSSVLVQVIILSLSFLVLREHWGIVWLMATFAAASFFNFVYSVSIVRAVWKISARPIWDKAMIKYIIALTIPFGLFMIVQRFYTYFDSVLLFKLAGDRAVGLYQIPFKIIIALQFLPMAFVASLYPALSSYWHNARERLAQTFEQAILYCLIISIPITLGAIALSDKIVLLFKGDFLEAASLLKISMVAVPFMFLGFPVGSLLNACDQQKRNTLNMAITAVLSAIINIILIPRYGVLGACITTLITSLLMLILGLVVVPKITSVNWLRILNKTARYLAAGLGMAIFAELVKAQIHPLITIGACAVVYAILLFVFRGISKDELAIFTQFMKPKKV